jgi:cytochrome d ubiquinol oxidase subunit II
MTIWQAAAATESPSIVLANTRALRPGILAYTVLASVIFRGKATKLSQA